MFHATSGALWSGPPPRYLNLVTVYMTSDRQNSSAIWWNSVVNFVSWCALIKCQDLRKEAKRKEEGKDKERKRKRKGKEKEQDRNRTGTGQPKGKDRKRKRRGKGRGRKRKRKEEGKGKEKMESKGGKGCGLVCKLFVVNFVFVLASFGITDRSHIPNSKTDKEKSNKLKSQGRKEGDGAKNNKSKECKEKGTKQEVFQKRSICLLSGFVAQVKMQHTPRLKS